MNNDNAELKALYEADQQARETIGNNVMTLSEAQRKMLFDDDINRKEEVAKIINAGLVVTKRDFYHAGVIYQHGISVDDAEKAHQYFKHAWELGESEARWMVAASYDRLMRRMGKPQKYGTQYESIPGSNDLHLAEIDPTTTDAERIALGVPPLNEISRIFNFSKP